MKEFSDRIFCKVCQIYGQITPGVHKQEVLDKNDDFPEFYTSSSGLRLRNSQKGCLSTKVLFIIYVASLLKTGVA